MNSLPQRNRKRSKLFTYIVGGGLTAGLLAAGGTYASVTASAHERDAAATTKPAAKPVVKKISTVKETEAEHEDAKPSTTPAKPVSHQARVCGKSRAHGHVHGRKWCKPLVTLKHPMTAPPVKATPVAGAPVVKAPVVTAPSPTPKVCTTSASNVVTCV